MHMYKMQKPTSAGTLHPQPS